MSFTATTCLPRVQASTPVEAFGPVPATVYFPKLQAPQGTRFCEEVNAFVPADLKYRIRGIRKQASQKKSLVERLLKKPAKNDTPLVMAMGLTHAKLHLIPLDQAQQDAAIRYHDIADASNSEAALDEIDIKKFKTELIPLWEAQTRPDIVYRGKNPLRAEVVARKTDCAEEADGQVPQAPRSALMAHLGVHILIPPS